MLAQPNLLHQLTKSLFSKMVIACFKGACCPQPTLWNDAISLEAFLGFAATAPAATRSGRIIILISNRGATSGNGDGYQMGIIVAMTMAICDDDNKRQNL